MKRFSYLLFCTLFLFVAGNAGAQKIESMESELKSSGDNNSGGNSEEWFWVDLFFNIGFWPTYGVLFGFENEPSARFVGFNEYPYADAANGLYLPVDESGRRIRTQLTAHIQNNEDAVYGGYFQVKFSPNRYLTLDVNHLHLFETLEDQEYDRFSISNFQMQVNRIRHPKLHLWWGGGVMLLSGDQLYGGPAMSGGFTWFFKRPLSLHAETQIGLPNGVFARQHQVRMQVHLDRFMIYAGYQGFKAGSTGVPNWSLGSGMWF